MRISDWSSDVCSSDLLPAGGLRPGNRPNHRLSGGGLFLPQARPPAGAAWTGKKSRRLMQLSNIPKITTCQMWNDFVMDIDTSSDKSCTAPLHRGPTTRGGTMRQTRSMTGRLAASASRTTAKQEIGRAHV